MSENDRKYPTICLNMIVKNESHIIERALNSVVNLIDTFCIVDTGSTDNTIELINDFFKEKKIFGKIVSEPFINFAYNRTHAIKEAGTMADYLLFIDADMIFTYKLTKEEIKNRLIKYDVLHVYQGTPDFYYKNVRFAKIQDNLKYVTPTHEYFKSPPDSTYGLFERNEIFINDKGDGGSKQNKSKRDIELLSRELESLNEGEENRDRCFFYLANSYSEIGEYEKAIEFYKKRVDCGGWIEEIWQSLYKIGIIYNKKGEYEKAVYYWMEAFEKYPERIENLYRIINYYREREHYHIAYVYWYLANELRNRYINWGNYLFLENDIYEYLLDYEYSILGYYVLCDKEKLSQTIMKVISHPSAEIFIDISLKNYKYYVMGIRSSSSIDESLEISKKELLYSIGKSLMKDERDYVSSTPSIVMLDKKIAICVRFVNYSINEKGEYINKKNITSKNILALIDITNDDEWKIEFEEILKYDESIDNLYIGLEDVRLFTKENKLLYNANRGLSNEMMSVEHGIIEIMDKQAKTTHSGILKILPDNIVKKRNIEKNWVLFEDEKGNTKCVYSWNPLVIGNINTEYSIFELDRVDYSNNSEYNKNIPIFFERVRGSSNGVLIPSTNEIWFLCHIVSYEEKRRYYHLFVVLDRTTQTIIKYTRLFTFDKNDVEYSTGFVYFKETDKFLIGFSIMDRTSDYIIITKKYIDSLMIDNKNNQLL